MTARSPSILGVLMFLLHSSVWSLHSSNYNCRYLRQIGGQLQSTTPYSFMTLFSGMRGSRKYIPPLLEERLKDGRVKPSELDRCFPLSERDIEDITKETALEFPAGARIGQEKKFNIGVIFSLESTLCDVSYIYKNAFQQLIPHLPLLGLTAQSQSTVSKLTAANICDSIGSDIKDCLLALYDVQSELEVLNDPVVLNAAEIKFLSIFRNIVDNLPRGIRIDIRPGAEKLLNSAIEDGNDVMVSTRLPRMIALRLLQQSGLASLLVGRVNPNNLVIVNDFGDTDFDLDPPSTRPLLLQRMRQSRYSIEQHVLKCCYALGKNTLKTVYVDGNRRNVLRVKRLGVNVVAVRGDAINPYDLKVADKLVDSLETVRMKDIYKIIKHSVISAQGPGQQTQSAAVRKKVRKVMGTSAELYVSDGERDTFGDEFGSDLF